MAHYEQRLEHDLKQIHEDFAKLANKVQQAVKHAVHAFLTGNDKLAAATILGDMPINRATRRLDRQCHTFIARHLPSAGHLRFISSVIRTNIELERIGDYAVTICRESVQLSRPPSETLAREIELMAEDARDMLAQAVAAFKNDNAEAAKATMAMAAPVGRSFGNIIRELIREDGEYSNEERLIYFVIGNMLERVADQSKNICEETVFAVTGESKAPKVYRILFLDEDNSSTSQIAEAIARSHFPNSGMYRSAGRQAARQIEPAVRAFLEKRGLDLGEARPKGFDLTSGEFDNYHVAVSLQGPLSNYFPRLPFHTVGLEWDLGESPTGLKEEEAQQRLEEMYRDIALHVQDLMQTLRGREAP